MGVSKSPGGGAAMEYGEEGRKMLVVLRLPTAANGDGAEGWQRTLKRRMRRRGDDDDGDLGGSGTVSSAQKLALFTSSYLFYNLIFFASFLCIQNSTAPLLLEKTFTSCYLSLHLREYQLIFCYFS